VIDPLFEIGFDAAEFTLVKEKYAIISEVGIAFN
jgi:hypothetical protein